MSNKKENTETLQYKNLLLKLKDLEESFHLLVENVTDIIYIHDLHGRPLFLNKIAQKMMGVSEENYENTNIFDIIHPDDKEYARDMMQRKLKGETARTLYTIRAMLPSGEIRYLQINSTMLMDEGKPYAIQGIARDITDEIKRKEDLGERSRELHLLNNFSDSLMRLMPDSTKMMRRGLEYALRLLSFEAGAIFKVEPDYKSATAVAFRGLSKNFTNKVKILDLTDNPEQPLSLLKQEVALIEGYRDSDFPGAKLHRNEGLFDYIVAFAVHGGVHYAVLILSSRVHRDVGRDKLRALRALVRHLAAGLATAQAHQQIEKSKNALVTANQIWRTTFDAIADSIIITDNNGNIAHMNAVAETRLNTSSRNTIGKSLAKMDYFWCPNCGELISQVLESGQTVGFEIFDSDTEQELSVVVSPMRRGREIFGAVFVISNISEQRKVWRQLSQSQKMESIGLLASGIAHNFNNLLMSMSGYLFEIRSGLEEHKIDIEEPLSAIEQTVDDAAETVRQLMLFSRREPIESELLDVVQLVRDEVFLLNKALPKNIIMRLKAHVVDAWVMGNPQQLRHAIVNLCINARDAMPKGGTITISVEKEHISHNNSLELVSREYVILSVRDTGKGVPTESMNRIFDPFFTTKEPGKGTGLGLSMVYRMARALGGNVAVQSKVGRGTRIEIYMPISSTMEHGKMGERTRDIKIIILEGNESLRKLFQSYLEKKYETIKDATDAEEMLKLADEFKPDVVLIDPIKCSPECRELYREILKISPKTSLLILTAQSPDRAFEKMIKEMGGKFLLKPFKLEALDSMVEKLVQNKYGNKKRR